MVEGVGVWSAEMEAAKSDHVMSDGEGASSHATNSVSILGLCKSIIYNVCISRFSME